MSLGRKEDPFAGTILFSHIPFLRHISVNACLMPVLAADGCHVTTVEGVGTVKGDNLHPIQKAMVDMHGSQCGKYKKLKDEYGSILLSHNLISFAGRILYAWNHRFFIHSLCQQRHGATHRGAFGWKFVPLYRLSTHLGCS